ADTAQAEAEGFIASVHGAMLLARAYGTADIFAQILDPALRRLAPH
ncbi:TetR/AcrR family transcriptional regulator, partial [Thioclava sp. BHET1]